MSRSNRVLLTTATLVVLAIVPSAHPANGAGLDLPNLPETPAVPEVEVPPRVNEALGQARENVGRLADRVAPGVIPPSDPVTPVESPPAGGAQDGSPTTDEGSSAANHSKRSTEGSRAAGSPRGDAPSRRSSSVAGRGKTDLVAAPRRNDAAEASDPGLPARLIEALAALPLSLLAAVVGLALLGLTMTGRSAWLSSVTSRLRRHELELQGDVGVLQDALLPPIPDRIGSVDLSVAYRAADGPAAGGDFHDILPLDDGRVGILVGDVSGHGREALAATALVHYTLRAHLEAGVRPCQVLRLADTALSGKLQRHYATVLVGVYDASTSTLDYATAGHPAPLIRGEARDHAVQALAPPIGLGPHAGSRETRVSIERGSTICFFTDGLIEARDAGGQMVQREGLASILGELGGRIDAAFLLDGLPSAASGSDDRTACLLRPLSASGDGTVVEEIEIEPSGLPRSLSEFLVECGMSADQAGAALEKVRHRDFHGQGSVLRIERSPSGVSWRIGGNSQRREISRAAPRAPRPTRSRLAAAH